MSLFGGLVHRHFRRKVEQAVEVNLARLAAQWEEAARGALNELGKEAQRRLGNVIATTEQMLLGAGRASDELAVDIGRLRALQDSSFPGEGDAAPPV